MKKVIFGVIMLEQIAQFDQRLFLQLNNGLRSPLGDFAFGYSTWLGEGYVLYPLCLILAFIFDRKNFKRNAVLITFALIVGGLLNAVLKEYFQRLRPLGKFEGWKESGYWHPGPHENYTVMFHPFMYNSFPSGHCAGAFSAIMLFSMFYRRLTPLLFLIGFIIMISRVYVGAHFPLDTVGGALVGIVSAYSVRKLFLLFYPRLFGGDAGVVKRTRL